MAQSIRGSRLKLGSERPRHASLVARPLILSSSLVVVVVVVVVLVVVVVVVVLEVVVVVVLLLSVVVVVVVVVEVSFKRCSMCHYMMYYCITLYYVIV